MFWPNLQIRESCGGLPQEVEPDEVAPLGDSFELISPRQEGEWLIDWNPLQPPSQ